MKTDTDPAARTERARLASFAGWAALAAIAAFALAVMIGDFLIPGNDMVADTISAMAAGRMAWIVDTGIIAYAMAFAVLAIGAAVAHPGDRRWSFGIMGLLALALAIFLVGFRDEYGDGDAETGEEWHTIFVYCLGALFTLVPWAMSRGADKLRHGAGRLMRWAAGLWLIAAPWFFFLPTGWDGLYERGLGVITFLFVAALARVLIGEGRN